MKWVYQPGGGGICSVSTKFKSFSEKDVSLKEMCLVEKSHTHTHYEGIDSVVNADLPQLHMATAHSSDSKTMHPAMPPHCNNGSGNEAEMANPSDHKEPEATVLKEKSAGSTLTPTAPKESEMAYYTA